MKKLQLLIFLSFSLFTYLSAQNSEDTSSSKIELKKGQHKVGISTGLNSFTLLTHRYAIKKDLLLRSSLRGGFGNGLSNLTFRNVGLTMKIGIEKHKPFKKEWSFYYGAEAHLGGTLSDFGDGATVGITGLAGITYHPFKNVSLFTEFGLGPGYTWSDVEILGFSENSGIIVLGGLRFGVLINIGK